ncbi:MAG: hypothetical protein ACE145_14825 [Terriglobia bacterium]
MAPSRKRLTATLLIAACVGLAFFSLDLNGADKEGDLAARLKRESNPVKKAKIEIRLSRFKLNHASEAFERGDVDAANKFLADYLQQVKSAWTTLQGSGRRASRKPAGFKELDIALREDARFLEDLKHRVSYMVREPVEKTAKEVDSLRNEVLKALFPTEPPRKPSKAVVRKPSYEFLLRAI